MTRTMRFSSAALGMVMLAGLAYYQGDGGLTAGQEAIMAGTAVAQSAEMRDMNCESASDSELNAADNCPERDRSEDRN